MGLNSGERWIVWMSFNIFQDKKQALESMPGILDLIATGLKVVGTNVEADCNSN